MFLILYSCHFHLTQAHYDNRESTNHELQAAVDLAWLNCKLVRSEDNKRTPEVCRRDASDLSHVPLPGHGDVEYI
jgi:hypothetical protein